MNIYQIIFGGTILLFIVVSVIFVYHWHRFSMGNRFLAVMEALYFLGALLFIGLLYSSV